MRVLLPRCSKSVRTAGRSMRGAVGPSVGRVSVCCGVRRGGISAMLGLPFRHSGAQGATYSRSPAMLEIRDEGEGDDGDGKWRSTVTTTDDDER